MTEVPDIERRRLTTRRSVTRDNSFPIEQGGGYFQILIPSVAPQSSLLPSYLPPDPRMRDRILASTVRADAMWGAAIGIAITKASAMAWDVKSEVALRSQKAQELLLGADATSISGIGGWVSYMGKQVRDFTCTNSGCFTEIIRATGAYGSRIVGLGHLSSLRMRRTGDPEYPYIYLDRWGRQHVMRWWQLFNLTDMPESDEMSLGIGLCAAERAYHQIKKLAALEQYIYEKVSGSRPLAIHIVNGLQKDQLTDMMANATNMQAQKGMGVYMGAVVMTTLKPDAAPSLVTIPLAELPDGFDADKERARADLIYANSLGLDPQDLRPMSNQQMGAGAQSHVLNQKAEGRGQAAYRQQLTHMLNMLVLDAKTQFAFTERNFDDQKSEADVFGARATAVEGLVDKQIISAQQGLQVLIDKGELPAAFLDETATPSSTELTDTEKPEVVDDLAEGQAPPAKSLVAPAPTSTPPTVAAASTETKAEPATPTRRRNLSAEELLKRPSTRAGARRLLRQVQGGVKFKEGVWRTIHGHPVLIGGGGGGGGAKSGGGKAPAKTYVPKPAAGGSSMYPTLDAYKKGTLSHADTLVQLKADIKAAKAEGNTKAVNSLTSHYYAIKNGPHAGQPAVTQETLGGMGKPSPKVHPLSEADATLAAHHITEAYANDEIKTSSEMHAQLALVGAQSGHTSDQLLLMAQAHEAKLHAAGQSAPVKDSVAPPAKPPQSTIQAHDIMLAHAQGAITAQEMGQQMGTLSNQSGKSKAELVDAATVYHKELQGPNAPSGGLATGDKFAPIKGSALHSSGQVLDEDLKKGIASAEDVATFHANVKSQIAQEQMKVDSAKAAIASAASIGYPPLPAVVAFHEESQKKIEALQALDKHIAATEGLYGVGSPLAKSAKAAGISEQHLQTALNINNLYEQGTIKLTGYQQNMQKLADDAGISKQKLEQVVFDHMTGKIPSSAPKGPMTIAEAKAAHAAAVAKAKLNLASKGAYVDQIEAEAIGHNQYGPLVERNGKQYQVISEVENAHEWGAQQTPTRPYSAAEKRAMYDYSYQGDEAINTKLRFGKDLDYPNLHPAQEPKRRDKNIAALDSAMAKSKVPTDVIVHRGFTNPALLERLQSGQAVEGAVFKDNGFVSTAVSSSSAFSNDIKMHINVPAGSIGAYIAPHVKPSMKDETELLLPRGSHFRITGYTVTTGFGGGEVYEVQVDYLGTQEIPGALKEVSHGKWA